MNTAHRAPVRGKRNRNRAATQPPTCTSRMHSVPNDAMTLIGCAHAGRRVLELEAWYDGEYTLHGVGGAQVLRWDVSVGGLFDGRDPVAAFEEALSRLFPVGCFTYLDRNALAELSGVVPLRRRAAA